MNVSFVVMSVIDRVLFRESRLLTAIGRALTLGLPTVLLNIGTDIPPVLYPLFQQRRHVDGDG